MEGILGLQNLRGIFWFNFAIFLNWCVQLLIDLKVTFESNMWYKQVILYLNLNPADITRSIFRQLSHNGYKWRVMWVRIFNLFIYDHVGSVSWNKLGCCQILFLCLLWPFRISPLTIFPKHSLLTGFRKLPRQPSVFIHLNVHWHTCFCSSLH